MEKDIKVLCVVGARPNFIKIAPLMKEIKKYWQIKPVLVHTGQHYDYEMSKMFFDELRIPKPDYNLGVGLGSHAQQTSKIMIKLEPILLKEKPNLVIVVGDVNSTLAGALTAAKLCIPVAHIEAGMRSYDKTMPEEINRVLTDYISDFLFVTSHLDTQNLLREGISRRKIFLVGNIMTDVLIEQKKKVSNSILKKLGLQKKNYAVLTLHRAGNVDDKKNLKEILEAIKKISKRISIVFPIHPRTKKMINLFGFKRLIKEIPTLFLIKPLSYSQMTSLVKNSKLVLTDSGGLQHETTVLGVPCFTLRETTEWLITLSHGTNRLTGISKKRIMREVFEILENKKSILKIKIPRYWDGKTSQRIVKVLLRNF